MYLSHFGLDELPFSLTPDTDYFFAGADQQEAVNVLLVALRQGEGFIKLTGEVGLGKTLVCRKLLAALDADFATAYIPNPDLTPKALYVRLAEELGAVFGESGTQDRVRQAVTARLLELARAGRSAVVLLDEAQELPDQTLEAIRLLTNLETEKFKLLQVVLVGQPELDRRLGQPRLRQLRQRITFSYSLTPMDFGAFRDYVRHRLAVAGHRGRMPFDDDALRVLYRASRGIPRLANILCHKALLAAYGLGDARVARRHARAAVRDTEGAHRSPRGAVLELVRDTAPLAAGAALVSLALAWLAGGLL